MHSPRRRGRVALATFVSLFGIVITDACSDTASPRRINVDNATPARAVEVQAPGLVAAYGFDEPSGTATLDASGNNNRGLLSAGVTRSASGRFGAALAFNKGMITIANSTSLMLTRAMTLEAWVKPSSVTSASQDVMTKGRDNYYLLATSANGLVAGGGSFTGSWKTTKALSRTPPAANAWTHVAVTYDGAAIRLYVNGTQESTVARKGALTRSTRALQIGGDPIFGRYFQGTIDEVRIYNRALSSIELQVDMNTPIGGNQTSPPTTPPPSTDTEAPKVAITSPTSAASYTTTTGTLTLSGTASDNVGVTSLTWSNNRGGSGSMPVASTWSASGIALQSGANVLTVTARDSANNSATTTLTATYNAPSAPTPTSLLVQRQPSATAQSGVPLAQQPVIQLRDAANYAIPVSGVTVAATIGSGGGSLGGTTLVATNASGVAIFTNLQITGTAGTRTLTFSATGLTPVTSTAIAVSVPGPIGGSPPGSYPNRPSSFTQSSEIDFSQAIPSLPDNVDRPISGASGWNMIYFGNNWSKTTDAGAAQSPSSIWQGHWAPGSYGGGVLGQGGGHGIGNVFTYAANGTTRLYVSLRVYFDFDASQWHPISNKFVNLETDKGLILVQLNEGGNWRHAEELASPGFGVDNNGQPGSIPGQVDNRPVPVRQWTQIEVLVDLPGHVFKIWQDGVLTTNATPTFGSTKITTFGINAFRGGGGETLTTDLYWKYDHFFIAW